MIFNLDAAGEPPWQSSCIACLRFEHSDFLSASSGNAEYSLGPGLLAIFSAEKKNQLTHSQPEAFLEWRALLTSSSGWLQLVFHFQFLKFPRV